MLDPAAGTLTFPAEAAKLAVEEFVAKYGEGAKNNFIKEGILKNFYAFELMMAPYAIGHLKMSFLLEELGYKLHADDRFKLYLTNTLDMEELEQTDLPGMVSLSEESHLAGLVKKDQPILVIMGNPPYSGHSANVSEKYIKITLKNGKEKRKKVKTWIGDLIEDYKVVDGKPLGEKNPKWLQDDYVKFIRFAQWKIDQAGEGVLGFITNHGYLDNPTFRGMRQSLMNSFNEIYILDLHGNTLKKEICPDGSKDENVFDIRQGVAIALYVKKKNLEKECNVYHSEIWGLRNKKYDWLENNQIKSTQWEGLCPKTEFYLFVPRDEELLEDYDKYIKVTEIFPTYSVGIVTARDSLVTDINENALIRRIRMLQDEKLADEIVRQAFNLRDKSNWTLTNARRNLFKNQDWKKSIEKISYRPFDVRWIFYEDAFIERPRREVMDNMVMRNNIGLITRRQMLSGLPCNYFFVSDLIICDGIIRSDNKGSESLFPLYYTDYKKKDLFNHKQKDGERKPNFNPEFYKTMSGVYGKELSPEEIFYYIYGVLYSNIYRTKYAEFLKIDFPRVPFTKNYKVFGEMAELGERLVQLHLMKSTELDPPIAKFPIAGDDKVDKPAYKDGRVYINKEQYFEGVEKEVWEYQIGGYQVCHKWLKDRKGRKLMTADIRHYCKVVTSLKKTIEIQELIGDVYEDVEKDTIDFSDLN